MHRAMKSPPPCFEIETLETSKNPGFHLNDMPSVMMQPLDVGDGECNAMRCNINMQALQLRDNDVRPCTSWPITSPLVIPASDGAVLE